MAQLENMEAIERRLWKAADRLRSNSELASNEFFLTQFADQGAHDGGEFFTPISLVQLLVNVIEPDHGKIFDPACGSGGMFVQSAHFMECHKQKPTELTFYGNEKNKTTTRLAKMNLAVHGLEGNIAGGVLSYYDDPHDKLWGNEDFVMANPPFNVCRSNQIMADWENA